MWLPGNSTMDDAARLVTPPPIARLLVYVTHFKYGGWHSPSIDVPTTIPASGPNRTAAKGVGSTEIIDCRFRQMDLSALPDTATRPKHDCSRSAEPESGGNQATP
jgi:hypothetical protein